ncbi:hypothetical protein BGW36DRAFT_427150 [Talaromyces proteolyticus]|uniref:Only prolin and serin are matching in the corresponding protein n=1 Tax=Talaromyces proteolyticus TaxID=1131652 RepID=A0AAD4KVQ8_9EURO|nr:uncharacterized protein BGW36DRAFT_427150 [Talaromyces proteolyticus]KAH8697179.1 hypothetical protein BGW36DRAFT_427150 [Talaromyces proteolyticus]
MNVIEPAADHCNSLQTPVSPTYTDSSAPASPAVSSFSLSRPHSKFSSSVSSLISSPGMGISMERSGSWPTQLREVKEEPFPKPSKAMEDEYFGYFDQFTVEPDEMVNGDYYLADELRSVDYSTRQRSESLSSRGLPRFSSRISSASSRWKPKHSFDGTLNDNLHSRASSTSSALRKMPSREDALVAASPARLSQDTPRRSASSLGPIDIEKANSISIVEEHAMLATTPLLPPMLATYQSSASNSGFASPLQSPSVADVSDLTDFPPVPMTRTSTQRSPPLSTKPSITSLTRAGVSTQRTISGEGVPPLVLTEGDDEWASKLGHANFTIHPEPYIPENLDALALQRFREDWQLARRNYAKHLVRTGEHYGETSMTYQFTKDKLDCIEQQWKRSLEVFSVYDARLVSTLSASEPDMSSVEGIKIPHLHNNEKFPELGDEEIVGPMAVAPAIHCTLRCKSPRRRNVFKILHDLINKAQPGLTATNA